MNESKTYWEIGVSCSLFLFLSVVKRQTQQALTLRNLTVRICPDRPPGKTGIHGLHPSLLLNAKSSPLIWHSVARKKDTPPRWVATGNGINRVPAEYLKNADYKLPVTGGDELVKRSDETWQLCSVRPRRIRMR